jgi:hypothetical protein
VVDINEDNLWYTRNIAFYRSSGRSVKKSGNDRTPLTNVWLPIMGINDGVDEKGHIIKGSFINNKENVTMVWIQELLQHYIGIEEIQNIDNEIRSKIIINDLTTLQSMMQTRETVISLYNFISTYFIYDWQLYISARLSIMSQDDSSNWIVFPGLRDLVLGKYSHYDPIFVIPDISHLPLFSNDLTHESDNIFGHTIDYDNAEELINFLVRNDCQPSSPVNPIKLKELLIPIILRHPLPNNNNMNDNISRLVYWGERLTIKERTLIRLSKIKR